MYVHVVVVVDMLLLRVVNVSKHDIMISRRAYTRGCPGQAQLGTHTHICRPHSPTRQYSRVTLNHSLIHSSKYTHTHSCVSALLSPTQEYSNNIIGSGVHGALLFLERSQCSSDHLANILHIPASKVRPRRHLAVQLAQLFASEDLNR